MATILEMNHQGKANGLFLANTNNYSSMIYCYGLVWTFQTHTNRKFGIQFNHSQTCNSIYLEIVTNLYGSIKDSINMGRAFYFYKLEIHGYKYLITLDKSNDMSVPSLFILKMFSKQS